MYKLTKYDMIIRKIDNTFIPMDEGNRDYQEYLEWLQNGNQPEPALSPEELIQERKQELNNFVQSFLDGTAQSFGYDSILSACSYASVPNAFQEEGIKFVQFRSECWIILSNILNDVDNGKRDFPNFQELIKELPKF